MACNTEEYNPNNMQKCNNFIVLLNTFPIHPTLSKVRIDCLVHDCSSFIANKLELLQFCTKPSAQ